MNEDEKYTSRYSRADAIADGVLIDVTEQAKEAGFKFPVAVTRLVWDKYVEFDESLKGFQDIEGRLWDILGMLHVAIKRKNEDPTRILYALHVMIPNKGNWTSNEENPERGTGLSRQEYRKVTLLAVCGPGDTLDPVITIMTPNES